MWSLKAPRRVPASGVREENSELRLQAAPNVQTAVSRPVPDRCPWGQKEPVSLGTHPRRGLPFPQFSGNAGIPLCRLCISGPLWTDSVIITGFASKGGHQLNILQQGAGWEGRCLLCSGVRGNHGTEVKLCVSAYTVSLNLRCTISGSVCKFVCVYAPL